jgi:hypothetical protein
MQLHVPPVHPPKPHDIPAVLQLTPDESSSTGHDEQSAAEHDPARWLQDSLQASSVPKRLALPPHPPQPNSTHFAPAGSYRYAMKAPSHGPGSTGRLQSSGPNIS